MADVLAYFDTKTIPSGTASMTVKIGGFICAEGAQNGRAIPAVEHTITIMPLFSSFNVDFSTCWYKDGDYVSIPLNGSAAENSNLMNQIYFFYKSKSNLSSKYPSLNFTIKDIYFE